MAPTKISAALVARPPRDDREAPPVRQLRNLRWGLIPSWAKDSKIGSRMINARAETVAEKPAFRRAFATRRALIPADGFYEWFPTQQVGRSGKPLKQPFFIHRGDGGVLALAGIYEFWRDPDKPDGDDDAWVSSFAVITTTATDDVGHIHDRMPMTVTRDRWHDWLNPEVPAGTAAELMAPPTAGELEVYAVSREVNNVKNNGPDLVVPLPEGKVELAH